MLLCFFDLDGTLLNTLEDLAEATNLALEKQGLLPIPADDYRFLLGKGVKNLAGQVLARQTDESLDDEERAQRLQRLLDDFLVHYEKHYACKTHPYTGITALLKKLQEQGIAFGVLSNKSEALSRVIIEHFFPENEYHFAFVHGLSERWPRKPEPDSALALAQSQGFKPQDCCFIGDSSTDMKTARNAEFMAVGVGWGFRDEEELWNSGADYVVHEVAELEALLLRVAGERNNEA